MASLHHHTPSLAALNPRGACVRKVAYHRVRAEEAPVARVTRSVFGHTGFLQEQWDPRLHTLHATDAGIKPNFSQRLSLSGQVLRNDSVDAGWRVSLLGTAGQPVKSWDARGGLQRHEYDRMLRQVAVFEQAQIDNRVVVQQLPDDKHNQPHDGDDGQQNHIHRVKPIGVIANIEHDLQRPYADD